MTEPAPECSIIVPLFNRSLFTRLFLLALRGVLPEKPRCEVLLVDNGSSDDTQAVLAELASEYRVLTLETNRNFAGGCNAGAAVSRGKYLYFLNNDTVPLPGFVEALVEALDRDASFVIAGSRLLYPDGRIQHAGLGINRARLPAHLYHLCPFDLPAANRRRVVQAVTGASLLIRRAEFEALGGFDGGFRNSFEDVDLCLKVGALGGRVLYCPESTLYHFESVSEGRHDHDEENRLRFLARWYDRVEPDEERIYAADGFAVDPRPIPESLFGLRYRLEQERLARHSWEHQAVRFAEKGARLLARLEEMETLRARVREASEANREAEGVAEPPGIAIAGVPLAAADARPSLRPDASRADVSGRDPSRAESQARPILLSSDLPARVEAGSPVAVRLEVAFGARLASAGFPVELFWRPAHDPEGHPHEAGEGEPVLAATAELAVTAEGLASGVVELAPPVGRGQWDLVVLTSFGAGQKRELGRERVLVWPRYGARYEPHVPATAAAGRTLRVPVVLRNTGMKVWDSGGTFQLGYRWSVPSESGAGAEHEGRCAAIGERVGPGEHLTILGAVHVPDRTGTFRLEFDLVEEGVAWFSHLGVAPEVTTIEVVQVPRPPAPAREPGRAQATHQDPLSRLLDERDQLLRLERMEAELRRQRLIARVAELEAGAAWLSSEVAALKAARADVIEQLGLERKERERTVAELELEQRRRDGLDRRLQEIEGSRLFRMLRPLRRWLG